MTLSSGFNQERTFYAGPKPAGQLIDDAQGLKGEFEVLTKEDLRERLFVAEKVMKSLFQRNKELEMAQGESGQGVPDS